MSGKIKQKVRSYFKEMQMVFSSTCDNERPFVRRMLLLYVNDKFWTAT